MVFVLAQCLLDKLKYWLRVIVYFPFHLLHSLSQYIDLISQHSDSTSEITIETFELFCKVVELVLVHTLLVLGCGSKLDLSYQLLQVRGAACDLNLVFDLQAFQSSDQLLLGIQLQPCRLQLLVDNVPYEYL